MVSNTVELSTLEEARTIKSVVVAYETPSSSVVMVWSPPVLLRNEVLCPLLL